MTNRSIVLLTLASALLASCAVWQRSEIDRVFGPPVPRDQATAKLSAADQRRWRNAAPLIANRCVVCHACYDAPCQVNLSAPTGVARGASKEIVYDGARLLATQPTRLLDDARTTAGWREKGFFPILNERRPTAGANLQAGVMARMLALKHANTQRDALPEPDLDAGYQCPTTGAFDGFAKASPERGMPFGLPPLPEAEYDTLMDWLAAGAPMAPPAATPAEVTQHVRDWEHFLNGDSDKQQLASRYLYEHLFLASLYFDEQVDPGERPRHWFRLVRSRTPPGARIDPVVTRRPYDDPGVARVFYRLQPVTMTTVAKTHMPYALNAARMAKWRQWFIDAPYTLARLPAYTPEVAANPFVAFQAIPVKSRYRFLLDEAQFTIMGFIKGPVCRGQVALNVIDDRFWVFFVDPDSHLIEAEGQFLASETMNLRLPAEEESNAAGLINWLKYEALQKRYLQSKAQWLEDELDGARPVDTRLVWDGDGTNPNAALTIFRHFDSATVLRGLVGSDPDSAWIIGYTLLERIHYLLVAGFDVYGNAGHQLNTRLYMDFLRMEGEANFLGLLPEAVRVRERNRWYRTKNSGERDYIFGEHFNPRVSSTIDYRSDNPKQELFALLQRRLATALADDALIASDDPHASGLAALGAVRGLPASLMPEASLLGIRDGDDVQLYSLLVNRSYSSVSHLLAESYWRIPEEDTLTVARGAALAYVNAVFLVDRDVVGDFARAVGELRSVDDYATLVGRFGVSRDHPAFWQTSDAMHAAWRALDPVASALFDYNRLQRP